MKQNCTIAQEIIVAKPARNLLQKHSHSINCNPMTASRRISIKQRELLSSFLLRDVSLDISSILRSTVAYKASRCYILHRVLFLLLLYAKNTLHKFRFSNCFLDSRAFKYHLLFYYYMIIIIVKIMNSLVDSFKSV